ncbi:D-alanyl-D-alanine carboxypeptidase family protein [Paenibacillus sp. GCM10023252]|uniref:D-alanyl-D-alanine carboxypeptidase family protein n=1 Tax=Paenibacillus sp. GCM10023252 TaxID=3252649 RepID=UPI0036152072
MKVIPMRLRKVMIALVAVSMVVMGLGSAAYAKGEKTPNSLGMDIASAILIDADSGQVLYEVNSSKPYPPASMTKLMTEYIVLEEISAKRLNWDTVVTTSKEAASTPPDGSQIYLAEGDQHSVKDLYIAMAVGSANDATIALASHISGSEQGFVGKMNETAKGLGLTSANFTSATGLLDTTLISAADMAKLAQNIIKKHPDFLDYSKIPQYKFRERDEKPMINYNWMLESNKSIPALKQYAYPGVDGMKTGYISAAGYTFTGTAKQGDIRLISVVMNANSKGARFYETAKLYNFGYNTFERKTVLAPKSVVETAKTAKVKKGKKKTVPIVTESDLSLLVKKGVAPKIDLVGTKLLPESELVAPIKAGDKVGTVTYKYTDADTKQSLERTVNLIAAKDVQKAGWFRLMFRSIGDFFAGLFQGIVDLF